MTTPTPFLPRIYGLALALLNDAAVLESQLARCRALGFDHVLAQSVDSDVADLSRVAQACARQKIKLLLDVNLSGLPAEHPLVEQHPAWFHSYAQSDDLPDPRKPILRDTRRIFRYDQPQIAREIVEYFRVHIETSATMGVTGFRCMDVATPPSFVWKDLIAAVRAAKPDVRFLAWTPGCTQEQLQALGDCGFDATFSSGAWWDYRSRWLQDEYTSLMRIAPPIAFPDSPDEPVIERVSGSEDKVTRLGIYRRALRLAATTGNGILIPMGFEYGYSGLAAMPAEAAGRYDAWQADAPFDLSEEIAKANAFVAENGARFHAAPLQLLSGADSDAAMLMRNANTRGTRSAIGGEDDNALIVVADAEVSRDCTVNEFQLLQRARGFVPERRLWSEAEPVVISTAPLKLDPAELQVFIARQLAPIVAPAARGKQAATAAARAPRIAIESVSPTVDNGRFAVKRTVGELINIEADVFMDGHDKLAVALLWRPADEAEWHEIRMQAVGNDRWAASLPVMRVGRYVFAIEAWRDAYATYRDELEKKSSAGLNVSLELEEGRLMVEAAAEYAKEQSIADAAAPLKAMLKTLKAPSARDKAKAAEKDAERIVTLLSEPLAQAMKLADARQFAVRSEPMRIEVERSAARYSSWYELFPRSQSGDPQRHGTFDDVIKRLPIIADMGFDTLYFTPIHPIGNKHRKGRNNSLTPAPEDPGSPYAIGSEEGGHDAIHPQLGTIEDFRRLRDEAARHGLELALDFAIQCSPDHPWLEDHPDWFDWRPDGSIRYAENPPKKYQDIVNVDFYAEGAVPNLWLALRDVVLYWVKEGVRVFRVDNPHTKPLPFWEWMIADIRGRYPDTIFLSEAFTRPKMMYRLAKAGFSQSYTYFTWRHSKEEFIDYITELTTTYVREFFRPHFFVNTPDINPYFLQRSGRPGFLIRAALATMLSGLWGMYNGFELCEAAPVPGKEEYLDSEKYEIRAWDWDRPGNIVREITQLNRIRAENPALQSHLGTRFLHAPNDNILYFMRSTEPVDNSQRLGDNVLLVAINLDPYAAHETAIELPLWEFGMPDDGRLDVEDLVYGTRFTWQGKYQRVRLDPFVNPYAIWRVRHKGV